MVVQSVIDECLEGLSDQHRMVVEVNVFDGLDAADTAERVNAEFPDLDPPMSEANVHKIVSRFRKCIRRTARRRRPHIAMPDDVQKLLSEYIAEHRAGGEADPIAYLDRADDADRPELTELIDAYLVRSPGRDGTRRPTRARPPRGSPRASRARCRAAPAGGRRSCPGSATRRGSPGTRSLSA